MAEIAGSGATADALAGVLPGERDEHPAAALTNTQPAAVTTRTGTLEAGLRALAIKYPNGSVLGGRQGGLCTIAGATRG